MSRFLRVSEGPGLVALIAVFVAIVFGLSVAARSLLVDDLGRAARVRAAQDALTESLRIQIDERSAVVAFRIAGKDSFRRRSRRDEADARRALTDLRAAVGRLHMPQMDAATERIALAQQHWQADVVDPTLSGRVIPSVRALSLANDVSLRMLDLAARLRRNQAFDDAATRRGTALLLAAESLSGLIVIVLIVVAARLRSAAKRAGAQREAARRLSEMREIANLVDDLLWTAGPDGAVDSVSPRWVAYSGRDESSLLGNGWQRSIHPDDLEPTLEDWRRAVGVLGRMEIEHRICDAKGTYRWFRTRAVPFRDAAGAVVGWFGFSSDIDAMHRRVETLERAYADERRLFEYLRASRAAPALPDVPFITFDAARVGGTDDALSAGWYEAVLLPDDRIFVCLGRGVGERGPEALDAIEQARRSIAAAAAEETCPRAVLARANTVVLLRRGSAIAALCGYFDTARQHFTYATAGHDAPLLSDRAATRALAGGGLPLGVLAGAEFPKHDVSIVDALLVLIDVDAGDEPRSAPVVNDAAMLAAIRNAAAASNPATAIGEAVRELVRGEAVVVTARGVVGGAAAGQASA